MSTYTAPCPVAGCRWMPVRRHSRQDAVTALLTHTRQAHENEEGGAVGRPHHTTQQDERRQQQ